MALKFFNVQKLKKENLVGAGYSRGGGMLGGHWSVYLRKDKSGGATLTVEEQDTHNSRKETTVYSVQVSALDELKNIILEYDLYGASKRPYSPIQALDADTDHYSCDFEKSDFSISGEQMFSKRHGEGLTKLRQYLYSLATGEGTRTIEPHELRFSLDGYTITYLMEEGQAAEDVVDLNDRYELTPYEESGRSVKLPQKISVEGLKQAEKLEKGTIVYYEPEDSLILVYADGEAREGMYYLGRLEYCYESTLKLISESVSGYMSRYK